MSGHNKWSQIVRQKGSADAAKSKAFGKFSKLITMESKKAAGSVTSPALAALISRAKEINMPKDSIDRAVAKGISKDAALEQVTYEFYGPAGVAIIVDAVTDNKNRTTQEIKHLITKNGFELGAQGSAAWAFTKAGNGTYVPNEPLNDISSEVDEDKLGEILSLFIDQDDVQQIYTNARGYENPSETD
jgi:YebC/PmpR family DNA-binding regulatory protein